MLRPNEVVVEEPGLFLGQHEHASCAVGEPFEHGASLARPVCRCYGSIILQTGNSAADGQQSMDYRRWASAMMAK
jgi:hypothetical protein